MLAKSSLSCCYYLASIVKYGREIKQASQRGGMSISATIQTYVVQRGLIDGKVDQPQVIRGVHQVPVDDRVRGLIHSTGQRVSIQFNAFRLRKPGFDEGGDFAPVEIGR